MNNKNIIYLFGEGRINRLNNNTDSSDEFFYGFKEVKKNYNNTLIVEMNSKYQKPVLKFIDKVLRKLSHLPFYLAHIVTFKNMKKILKAETIIATNDRIALSALPVLIIAKIFNKTNILVIVMGMLTNSEKYKNNVLDRLFMSIFLKVINQFFFLGKPEAGKAKILFPKYSSKFSFLPFCVNEEFWNDDNKLSAEDKKNIAFIGNDGNREYEKVVEIANSLPEINFTFVTQLIKKDDIPENVNLISGSWNENTISDEDIRTIYLNSKLTIIPLKDTIQPSGQSVTLQSLSVGTPVMITLTEGFWDFEKYQNNKNIIFIKDNSTESWVSEIKNFYSNKKLLDEISIEGSKLIKKEYNKGVFEKELMKFI